MSEEKSIKLVAYYCNDCKSEFYYTDDTLEYCPKCGSRNIEPLYDRDVRLLDLGVRREWEW